MLRLVSMGLGIAAILGIIIAAGIFISPQDELKAADAVVVVSGGDTNARTLEAVRLYKERWAPLLIFSGAAEDPKSPSNASVMRSIAVGQNVPSEVIALDETSRTTHQNANEVAVIIKAFQKQRLILVTSPYHQRRTAMEFQDRLGSEIEIINHSAPDKVWSKRWWWISPVGWYLTLTELPKIGFTWVNQQLTN